MPIFRLAGAGMMLPVDSDMLAEMIKGREMTQRVGHD